MNYAEILAIVTNVLMVQATCGDIICFFGIIRDNLMPIEAKEKLNLESRFWYAPLFLGVLANFTLLCLIRFSQESSPGEWIVFLKFTSIAAFINLYAQSSELGVLFGVIIISLVRLQATERE